MHSIDCLCSGKDFDILLTDLPLIFDIFIISVSFDHRDIDVIQLS